MSPNSGPSRRSGVRKCAGVEVILELVLRRYCS